MKMSTEEKYKCAVKGNESVHKRKWKCTQTEMKVYTNGNESVHKRKWDDTEEASELGREKYIGWKVKSALTGK